jgi:hypothetical protein
MTWFLIFFASPRHPRPIPDDANDGLPAIDGDALDSHDLSSLALALAEQGLHQIHICAAEFAGLAQAFGHAIGALLWVRCSPEALHGGLMRRDHLRHEHAFHHVPRADLDQGEHRCVLALAAGLHVETFYPLALQHLANDQRVPVIGYRGAADGLHFGLPWLCRLAALLVPIRHAHASTTAAELRPFSRSNSPIIASRALR